MIVEKNKNLESRIEKLQEELKKKEEVEASIKLGKAKAEKRRLEIQAEEAHNERIRLEKVRLEQIRRERVRQADIQTMPDFDEDPVGFMRVSAIQEINMMVSDKM